MLKFYINYSQNWFKLIVIFLWDEVNDLTFCECAKYKDFT